MPQASTSPPHPHPTPPRQNRLPRSHTTPARSKTESWQDVDTEYGTYEPLERIIYFEGGRHSEAACNAAMLYAQKAMRMKGRWIQWNSMTERAAMGLMGIPELVGRLRGVNPKTGTPAKHGPTPHPTSQPPLTCKIPLNCN